MDKVISDSQHTFVGGRQIFYVTLIANDMIDDMVHRKREGVLRKLNTEKAHDHVNWNFLDYMFMRIEFSQRWHKWVKACITIMFFAIMVNGGP